MYIHCTVWKCHKFTHHSEYLRILSNCSVLQKFRQSNNIFTKGNGVSVDFTKYFCCDQRLDVKVDLSFFHCIDVHIYLPVVILFQTCFHI